MHSNREMDTSTDKSVKVHKWGLIRLVDTMPKYDPNQPMALDSAIVQAARVSYGLGTKTPSDDQALIRYLYRHQHTTPFEMVDFKFHIVAPLFVTRQWLRHRNASVNEYSARYSVLPDKFYVPEQIFLQSSTNKQGTANEATIETKFLFHTCLDNAMANYKQYQELIEKGVSREQARMCLPVNIYTEFYWKIDLHNLFHFLYLRMDSHAQTEIREYACEIFKIITPLVPIACKAFEDYKLNAITLTKVEIDYLTKGIPIPNARERQEWQEKQEKTGIKPTTP